ncbi:MAG: pyridoxamine 5'-phosphate oxidase family protein [Chloroflexi bacterium]|nr:pyridoxamine 5'-phosphate oxidase family protein [Chloroflexota bacterium]
MGTEALAEAQQLAEKVGHVFIATAGKDGWPHLAAAKAMKLMPGGRAEVNEWFCPGTVANLKVNPRVSIVIWDESGDRGYQLLGEMEKMMDIGLLDGYTPEMKSKFIIPQVESQLVLRVERVIPFRHAPHSDVEEQEVD